MRRLLLAVLAVLVPGSATAALNAAVVWEVRTTGAATNGGGFRAGASGTDWTQQDAAQYAVTDGVTAGSTTITSATANFGTDVVGAVMYVEGGTGSVVANWYEITARGSATSITVDRSTGLTAGTGVTLRIGGALSTLTAVATEVVAGNTVYVKSGTYGETLTVSAAGGNGTPIQWVGYATTRGDNPTGSTRPLIDGASARASCLVIGNVAGNTFSFFRLQAGTAANITAGSGSIFLTSVSSTLAGTDGLSVTAAANGFCANCEFGANTDDGIDTTTASATLDVVGSYLHDNGGSGWEGTGSLSTVYGTIVESNAATGLSGNWRVVQGCTVWGNTGASSDGLAVRVNADTAAVRVSSTIFEANGRYGISRGAATHRHVASDYNSFSSNGTSAYNNVTAGSNDTATAAGFTDAAGGNFAIGTALKALGFPAVILGSASTSYTDIGAVQRRELPGVSRARTQPGGQ